MLVLSRREDDKIIFPNLGITVEVLRIAGRSVRLGVKAPPHVRVLRHELADKCARAADEVESVSQLAEGLTLPQMSNHDLRNRLNKASLGLSLVQKLLELGRVATADETLESVLAEFQSLENDLAVHPSGPPSPAPGRCWSKTTQTRANCWPDICG